MQDTTTVRRQSLGEEIANAISHGIGLAAALAAAPVLVIAAAHRGDLAWLVGSSVFAASMVLLYLASTLYHAIPHSRAKRVFKTLDHAAIYLLIAGTYTPFTLGVLRGAWGWTLFGLIWALALTGVVLKLAGGLRRPWMSTGLYVAMGWLVLVAIKPLWEAMPPWGMFWLVAGGVAYTGGVAFYAADHKPYAHFVWHLFVVAGTACHFVAVLWFSA